MFLQKATRRGRQRGGEGNEEGKATRRGRQRGGEGRVKENEGTKTAESFKSGMR
jgi:hypothetical protein